MKILLVVLMTLLSSAIFADGKKFVTPVTVGIDMLSKQAYVNVEEDISPVVSCGEQNPIYQIRWNFTTDVEKAAYSTALAALASGKQLNTYYIDGNCIGTTPTPKYIGLEK